MKYFFTLLLFVLCYAHFASTGGRRSGKRGNELNKLEKEISNLKDEIICLMEDAKECKKELKELGGKLGNMMMLFAKSK